MILDGNEPAFTEDEMTTTVYEQYSPLDSYGRCQTAEACVGEELMPDEKRGDISSVSRRDGSLFGMKMWREDRCIIAAI